MEEEMQSAFEMISYAGYSKSDSLKALKAIRDGTHDEVEMYLKNAEDKLKKAHEIQFQWLQMVANEQNITPNIVSIHAQDHLSMAIVMHDFANEMYLIIKNLREESQ